MKGPSEVKTSIVDNKDGLCTIEYIAEIPGLYEIMVYYGKRKKQIPG